MMQHDAFHEVDIPDKHEVAFDLVDGLDFRVTCDPAGLMSAYDMALADGSVLRIERRIVEILSGFSVIDWRKPSFWSDCDETRKRDKVLFVALWNGMTENDRASFLRNVVGLVSERVAA